MQFEGNLYSNLLPTRTFESPLVSFIPFVPFVPAFFLTVACVIVAAAVAVCCVALLLCPSPVSVHGAGGHLCRDPPPGDHQGDEGQPLRPTLLAAGSYLHRRVSLRM